MKPTKTPITPPMKALILLTLLLPSLLLRAQPAERTITIHLRGVYDSKISLLALSASRTFKPVAEVEGVRNGGTAVLKVAAEHVPGECVLRFDYRGKESDTPYPSEKNIFIYKEDLELWVHPMYSNNPDSTWFQPGEKENGAFLAFSRENAAKKEKLGVLQNFLMSYDDTGSKLFREALKEYDTRRNDYNGWLGERSERDRELFVSLLYRFQYVPGVALTGTEEERMLSLIDHYFDGMDFKDPLIVRTANINKWMDNYVNLYGQLVKTVAQRDSLFPLAGQRAIEKAKKGHPQVYGWMVDYFFRGYEQNGIEAGTKILQPYLDDPNCLTSKRQEIERRLKGMETLVPGVPAPDFTLKDPGGETFELKEMRTGADYILVLFWSADCSHCKEVTDLLYPWQQDPSRRDRIAVVAVSLDETSTEIEAWEKKTREFAGWKHLRGEEGVRSKVAADYYILATPVMVLIDAKTRKVAALPPTFQELTKAVK